jgi:hypothetical protein
VRDFRASTYFVGTFTLILFCFLFFVFLFFFVVVFVCDGPKFFTCYRQLCSACNLRFAYLSLRSSIHQSFVFDLRFNLCLRLAMRRSKGDRLIPGCSLARPSTRNSVLTRTKRNSLMEPRVPSLVGYDGLAQGSNLSEAARANLRTSSRLAPRSIVESARALTRDLQR